MKRYPVQSSNVSSIGYDEGSQTLEIEFKDGSIYQYYNVPSEIYGKFMSSPSKGQFVSAQLKGIYRYVKI